MLGILFAFKEVQHHLFFFGLLMVVGSSTAVFWVKIVGLGVKISPFG